MEANQILEQHLLSNAVAGAAYQIDEQESEEMHAVAPLRLACGHQRQGQQQQRQRPQPVPQARSRLCPNHFWFGDRIYTCHGGVCPPRYNPLAQRPTGRLSRATGNGHAGR